MRPASSGPMPRSRSAKVVPCAITNMLRSFASRTMTSCASASATPPRLSASLERSTKGITASDARRDAVAVSVREAADLGEIGAHQLDRRARLRLLRSCSRARCARCRASGALSRPSASNSLLALARCASPSAMRPWRASEASSSSCALRSKGESSSHSSTIRCRGVVRQRARQVFEQHGLDAAEAPALGGDPGIEHRAARDLQSLEQFAREQVRQLALPLDA